MIFSYRKKSIIIIIWRYSVVKTLKIHLLPFGIALAALVAISYPMYGAQKFTPAQTAAYAIENDDAPSLRGLIDSGQVTLQSRTGSGRTLLQVIKHHNKPAINQYMTQLAILAIERDQDTTFKEL